MDHHKAIAMTYNFFVFEATSVEVDDLAEWGFWGWILTTSYLTKRALYTLHINELEKKLFKKYAPYQRQ